MSLPALPEILAGFEQRYAPSPRPATSLAEYWISNVPDDYQLAPGDILAAPRATEFHSVAQLQALGLSGLYRRAAQS